MNQLETEQNLDVIDLRLGKDSLRDRDTVQQLQDSNHHLAKPFKE